MKVIIEAEESAPIWHHRETEELAIRIYANETFQVSTGETWYAGSPFANSKNYLEVPCELNGGRQLVHQNFEIDSTEDAPNHPDARYSAYIFARKRMIMPKLIGFGVPAVYDPEGELLTLNQTWSMLQAHRDARPYSTLRAGLYETGVVEYLITKALSFLRMSSTAQVGMAASSAAPVSPNFPIHVSVTDPLWLALQSHTGLAVAAGKDAMVDGVVSVLNDAVLETSIIFPMSQDEGVTGVLRPANILEGAGFDILSSNGGDAGMVGWVIFNL